MEVLTVRDTHAPLPPSMPQRDSRTRVTSSNEATIYVTWSPPVDNGGSPITSYILFMKGHDGTVTNNLFGHETTRWKIEGLHLGEVCPREGE
jgi:hypothetical protein